MLINLFFGTMSGADLLTFGIIADRFVGKTSHAKANVLSSSAYSVYVIVILKNGVSHVQVRYPISYIYVNLLRLC